MSWLSTIVVAKKPAEMSPSPTPSRVIPVAAPGSSTPDTSTMPSTAATKQTVLVRVKRSPSAKGEMSMT